MLNEGLYQSCRDDWCALCNPTLDALLSGLAFMSFMTEAPTQILYTACWTLIILAAHKAAQRRQVLQLCTVLGLSLRPICRMAPTWQMISQLREISSFRFCALDCQTSKEAAQHGQTLNLSASIASSQRFLNPRFGKTYFLMIYLIWTWIWTA